MASGVDKSFDDEFETYLHRMFYIKPTEETTKCDPSIVECFGVLSLTDMRAPDRKLWYIYYCKQPEVDDTLNRIFHKYGKKNMCEIFRKPTFSGVGLRARVKTYFSEKKWLVKGNLLEAPPKSLYNNDRMVRNITDLYNEERKMLYTYICMKHDAFSRYYK
ncbi:uncharacterized protein [Drosophila virilis]|uniref:Uncharacterized protein n=1 Tax=Drosophila virilis TaxID=7244 RepID=B4LLM8_DROVI|nr:uncharacterized protein LOC6626622 [Drosophila virilis]EDW60891.2 uncharacterized protein Dvir_GJ21739 [Drosophila virilis]